MKTNDQLKAMVGSYALITDVLEAIIDRLPQVAPLDEPDFAGEAMRLYIQILGRTQSASYLIIEHALRLAYQTGRASHE